MPKHSSHVVNRLPCWQHATRSYKTRRN